jgi:hypothetical protein
MAKQYLDNLLDSSLGLFLHNSLGSFHIHLFPCFSLCHDLSLSHTNLHHKHCMVGGLVSLVVADIEA